MDPTLLALLILGLLFVLLAAGMPIGFAMGLSAFAGTLLLIDAQAALALLGQTAYETAFTYNLSVVPMFVLMGYIAGGAGLSESLYRACNAWLGRRRGGRNDRHPDPAQHHHGDLRSVDRDQHREALSCRVPAGPVDGGRFHAGDRGDDPDQPASGTAGRARLGARKARRAAQRVGPRRAVPIGHRRSLYRHLLADRSR